MDEAGEKKLARKQRNRRDSQRISRNDALAALIQHRQGRDYLYWLLEITAVNQTPFTSNALTTAFKCGEQNIGRQIQAHLMEVAPDSFLTMLKEQEDDRRQLAADTADRNAAAVADDYYNADD